MKTIFKLLMFLIICCYFPINTFSQTATINYIDASGYPNIRAYYTYKDAAGKQIRPPDYSWRAQDVIINEAGKIRTHNPGSPFCADPNQKSFSAILVFDLSKSMQSGMNGEQNPPPGQAKWEVAFNGMKSFIAKFDPAYTECAIIEFGQLANIRIWFTTRKDSLLQIVSQEPFHQLNTNYNSAFLRNIKTDKDGNPYPDSTNSALYIAKFAKYKPVIIFLTDGSHLPSGADPGPFLVTNAFNKAKENGVYVFVVKIGSETLNSTSESNLSTMASVEGSILDNYARNVTDPATLIDFYDRVLSICGQVGYPAPCYAEWTSECDPNGTRTIDLNFPNHSNLTASSSFIVPDNIKPYLDISPKTINFRNVLPGDTAEVTVRIIARNNFVKFKKPNGYVSSNSRYTISDWGGLGPDSILDKDTIRFIKVRYIPTDSFCTSASINFDDILASSACDGTIQITGMLDQFVEEVNMGDAIVGSDKQRRVVNVFCNRSCKDVVITEFSIKTGDAGLFKRLGEIQLPRTVPPGDCVSDTFEFSPNVQGPKSSKINVVLDTGAGTQTLTSNITGNAIGQAGITSYNPVILPNIYCVGSTLDTLIYVKNTGPITLHIIPDSSGLEGINSDEFEYVPNPLPDSIKANDSIPVTIRFKPKNSGSKQCQLHIKSNAAGNNDYYIQINAIADSINYEPEKTIDLGIVCLGTPKNTTIHLANVGTKTLHISPNSVPSEFTFTEPWWDVPDSTTTPVSVTFTPTKDGPINFDVIFKEDLCDILKTVHFTGTVHDPKVTNTNIVVNSTVNTPKVIKVTIKNASTSVPLYVDTIVFDDGQFVYNSSVPSLPRNINPGDSIEVTFTYTPDTNEVVNTFLRMKGMPCKDVLIPLRGNPSQATVDIVIDEDHTALIGDVIHIPVFLRNANYFAESGTTSIDFDVTFDKSLLLPAPPPNVQRPQDSAGVNRTFHLLGVPVQDTNADQQILVLDLFVGDGNVTSTPLTISKTKSNKTNVVFYEDHGLFTVKEATDTLYTKNYEVFPGEVFDFEIWQANPKNLSSRVHQFIKTEVRCNASVLIGLDYDSTWWNNGDRFIRLKDIPIDTNKGQKMLKSFRFKAMLGNTDTSYIILQNSRAFGGKIVFDTVVSKLTLKGICVDPNGTKRLFEVTNPATLQSVSPNPANGITEVKFFLSEDGVTKIWLSNVLGDKIYDLANDYMKSGEATLSFDANDLPDGVYFVIMQTPTQIFKKRFNIIK